MRFRALTLAVIASLAGVAGCGGGKKADLRVSLFAEVDILDIMRARLKVFEAETGIKVDPVYIPYANYEEKLVTQLAAGSAPDVIWADIGLFSALHHRGAFKPLDEFMATDKVDLSDFYPRLVDFFTVEGKLFALPQDTAPINCVFYNKAMFKEAGLPYPKDDWTWDDFLKVCLKLTKKDKEGKQVYAFKDNYGPLWDGTIYSNGGRLVDDVRKPTRLTLDEPAAVEAVKFLADLYLKHKVIESVGSKNAVSALGQEDLLLRRVAMVRTGLWITPALRKDKSLDWDIVPFPRGPRAKHASFPTGGSGYAITKDCRDPAQAWKLVKFLASADSQAAYAATGYAQPARRKLAESDLFLKAAPPANKAFLLKAPDFATYDPRDGRWREILGGLIQPNLDLVWIGQAAPEEALKKITKEGNAKYYSGR